MTITTPAKQRLILLLILLISFGLKLTVWSAVMEVNAANFLSPDSASYEDTARAFLQTGAFAISPENPTTLQYHRTPGLPLLIAGIYLIFGEQQPFVILVLILLSLLTICVAYAIAVALKDAGAGLMVALLLALDVASFSYALKFLTETLFTLLIVMTLLFGVRLFQSNGKKHWFFWVGMGLTLATFVRPISYYLIAPIAFGVLIWMMRRGWPWSIAISRMLLMILPFVLLVGAWQIRNYVYLGSSQFSGIGSGNLFTYRAVSVVALRDGITFAEAQEQLYRAALPVDQAHLKPRSESRGQIDDRLMQQGLAIILAHPFLFVRTQINGAVPMLLGGGEGPLLRMLDVPMGQTLDREIFDALNKFDIVFFATRFASGTATWSFALAVIYLAIIYTGVLFWLGHTVMIDKKFGVIHWFMWGVMLYFIIISAGPEANSRFRVPIMPVLTIYAGLGYTQLVTAVKTKLHHE